ncbi:zinc ABC transporter substrate-binding protein [Betaproteobacteria bacterium SCGC AG-212-J23]|nr:zinc ABC transporter substrate-binding protein [Betaproteobacteria bacterium SCGC AG-212-J23]
MRLLLFLLAFASVPAFAAVNVFACEPEWASLAQELGGDKVSVVSATTARQDPHHIEARPSLIARMRAADLVVCSGSELEIGWLPLLLTQSGNGRVQPGSPGYLEASRYVLRLEVPTALDRSMGDVHPGGNPHIQTDPRNIAKVARVLAERLAQLDAANAASYRSRADSFDKRWAEAIARWEKQAAPLKGVPLVQHHKGFTYLIAWLGMREVGNLEPKPGIPPTTSHLVELVDQMKQAPAKVIVYSSYDDPKAAQFLSQRSGIPNVMLPFTVGGSDRAKDLFGYFDDLLARLLAPLQ